MSALDALGDRAQSGETGELVGADGSVEVHVCLQHGRIAWATSSKTPRTFREYLVRVCNLDDGLFVALVDRCRRERQPLGETLVAEGLASREQVITALRQQIAAALVSLARLEASQTVFLPRAWNSEHSLTFDFADVARQHAPVTPVPVPPAGPLALVQGLLKQVPHLQWVVHTDGERETEQLPGGAHTHAVAYHGHTIAHGARLVLMRRPDDMVIGVSARGGGSLWGSLPIAGPIRRTIEAMLQVEAVDDPGPSWVEGPQLMRSVTAPVDLLPLARVLVLETTTLAVVVLHGDEVGYIAREGIEGGLLRAAATARGHTLPLLLQPRHSVALRAWPGWWFGTAIEGDPAASAWLVMRDALPVVLGGLSWALLNAVARALGDQTRR
jgi:hypothetical protein